MYKIKFRDEENPDEIIAMISKDPEPMPEVVHFDNTIAIRLGEKVKLIVRWKLGSKKSKNR